MTVKSNLHKSMKMKSKLRCCADGGQISASRSLRNRAADLDAIVNNAAGLRPAPAPAPRPAPAPAAPTPAPAPEKRGFLRRLIGLADGGTLDNKTVAAAPQRVQGAVFRNSNNSYSDIKTPGAVQLTPDTMRQGTMSVISKTSNKAVAPPGATQPTTTAPTTQPGADVSSRTNVSNPYIKATPVSTVSSLRTNDPIASGGTFNAPAKPAKPTSVVQTKTPAQAFVDSAPVARPAPTASNLGYGPGPNPLAYEPAPLNTSPLQLGFDYDQMVKDSYFGFADGGEMDAKAARKAAAMKMDKERVIETLEQEHARNTAAPEMPEYMMQPAPVPGQDDLAMLNDGGFARGEGGPVSDDIGPVMLSDGEYVLPADTVAAIGKENLDALRMATHQFVDPQNAQEAQAGAAQAQGAGASPLQNAGLPAEMMPPQAGAMPAMPPQMGAMPPQQNALPPEEIIALSRSGALRGMADGGPVDPEKKRKNDQFYSFGPNFKVAGVGKNIEKAAQAAMVENPPAPKPSYGAPVKAEPIPPQVGPTEPTENRRARLMEDNKEKMAKGAGQQRQQRLNRAQSQLNAEPPAPEPAPQEKSLLRRAGDTAKKAGSKVLNAGKGAANAGKSVLHWANVPGRLSDAEAGWHARNPGASRVFGRALGAAGAAGAVANNAAVAYDNYNDPTFSHQNKGDSYDYRGIWGDAWRGMAGEKEAFNFGTNPIRAALGFGLAPVASTAAGTGWLANEVSGGNLEKWGRDLGNALFDMFNPTDKTGETKKKDAPPDLSKAGLTEGQIVALNRFGVPLDRMDDAPIDTSGDIAARRALLGKDGKLAKGEYTNLGNGIFGAASKDGGRMDTFVGAGPMAGTELSTDSPLRTAAAVAGGMGAGGGGVAGGGMGEAPSLTDRWLQAASIIESMRPKNTDGGLRNMLAIQMDRQNDMFKEELARNADHIRRIQNSDLSRDKKALALDAAFGRRNDILGKMSSANEQFNQTALTHMAAMRGHDVSEQQVRAAQAQAHRSNLRGMGGGVGMGGAAAQKPPKDDTKFYKQLGETLAQLNPNENERTAAERLSKVSQMLGHVDTSRMDDSQQAALIAKADKAVTYANIINRLAGRVGEDAKGIAPEYLFANVINPENGSAYYLNDDKAFRWGNLTGNWGDLGMWRGTKNFGRNFNPLAEKSTRITFGGRTAAEGPVTAVQDIAAASGKSIQQVLNDFVELGLFRIPSEQEQMAQEQQ